MMLDYNLMLSEGQDLTGISSGANADSTNTIDFGRATPGMGVGNPVFLIVRPEADLASGGSATLQVSLMDSADDSSWATVIQTPALDYSNISQGDNILSQPLPFGIRRYIKLNYAVGTASLTTAAVNAFLTLTPEAFLEDSNY